jgi:hypothetical protein
VYGGRKGTYDVTHEKEDVEVVGLTQALNVLVDVLWVETMISQAANPELRNESVVIVCCRQTGVRGRDLRNRMPVVLPTW